MDFIPALYDHYIHSGKTNFTYGQPFSYFSPKTFNRPPPGFFSISDLNRNAQEYSPTNSPINSPRSTSSPVSSPVSSQVSIPVSSPVSSHVSSPVSSPRPLMYNSVYTKCPIYIGYLGHNS